MEVDGGWTRRSARGEEELEARGSLLHAELAHVAGRSHRPGCGGKWNLFQAVFVCRSSVLPSKTRLTSKPTLCMCDNSWRSVSPLVCVFCVC